MSRVCIIGYGKMGRNHERVLKELGHEVWTVDVDPASGAQQIVRRLAALSMTGFDAICVATPIESLNAEAWQALTMADVLVEKPGATTTALLRANHELATKLDSKLFVGYTERFNPAVQALKENLYRIGAVKHISARRLGYAFDRAGDPALDLATHDLDVIDYLDSKPNGESRIPGLTLDHVARTKHHLIASLHLRDIPVTIEASHLHPTKTRTLEVVGNEGLMRLDYQFQHLTFIPARGEQQALGPVRQTEPLRREWEAFFNGEGSDGIAALTIAEQMVDPTVHTRRALDAFIGGKLAA
jgi:UDP-N-acetylglucosamine 3-dehydrogenase